MIKNKNKRIAYLQRAEMFKRDLNIKTRHRASKLNGALQQLAGRCTQERPWHSGKIMADEDDVCRRKLGKYNSRGDKNILVLSP